LLQLNDNSNMYTNHIVMSGKVDDELNISVYVCDNS
jgi:hypothetical protein